MNAHQHASRVTSSKRVHHTAPALAPADAASPLIDAILTLVPVSRWAFARVTAHGELEHFLSSGYPGGVERLARELQRQRAVSKSGSRIAAALAQLAEHESGVTLLFADDRSTFGVLTMKRTHELEPFSPTEIRILTLALEPTTDQLALLRLHPRDANDMPLWGPLPDGPTPDDGFAGATYVLDQSLRIVLRCEFEEKEPSGLSEFPTRVVDRLPAVLERSVRKLTSSWSEPGSSRTGRAARPVPFLVVRTAPVAGPTDFLIGVRIDRYRTPNSLVAATTKFHLSPREVQVLALLLHGDHLDEIGRLLHITSSTVQDHIRNMVEKTGSRNRSDLIARILGWEFAAQAN